MAKALSAWIECTNDITVAARTVQNLLTAAGRQVPTVRLLTPSASGHLELDSLLHDSSGGASAKAVALSGEAEAMPQRARQPTSGRFDTDAGRALAGLSRRESEVAQLVARGRTNRQIAAQLYLSEKTIERHMSRIFTKLDITGRASLATHVTRELLAAPGNVAART